MLAVTVSYVFSFSASLFVYRKHGGKFKNPKPELKPMLASSLPVTAMRTSSALLNSFVALLLPFLLRKVCGYSSTQATALYGVAMGMALPVLCMPTSFIGSIAVVIAPELSENYYKNHTKLLSSDIHNSIGIGLLIAIFLIPVLTAFGNPIGQFLYSNVLSGQIISRCAILLLPLCLSQISTTILNSLNCEKQTLLFYFPATTAMLLCTIFLTKFLGIYAYMLGLLLSFTITTVCNLALLHKKCPSLSLMPTLLQSLILTLVATLFGVFLSSILALFLPLLVQIVLGALLTILFTACFVILAMPQVATLFFRLPPVQTAKKWLVSMRKHTARTHHRQQEQKGTK
jgi:stage V sporulation protein B